VVRLRDGDDRRYLAAQPLNVHRWVVLSSALAAFTALAGCGSASEPPYPSTLSVSSGSAQSPPKVNQANIIRVRAALPDDYEVGELVGPLSAAALWGFGGGWAADPAQCGLLADPAPADRAARGLSASGPGGTVFVVSAIRPDGAPTAELLGQCERWAMSFGHTTAEVVRTDGPSIERAQTLAWRAVARTVVESGSETTADIHTAVTYFDRHVVSVTLVTDPGSPYPPLGSGWVSELLATTVTELRG